MPSNMVADIVDDEESSTSEEEEEQTYPFHLYGIGFFAGAILVGIITIILVVLLDGEIDHTTNGFLFRIFFAVFMVFLFSCICCTYYLGGSKTTWETPEFVGIRARFSNVVAVLGIIFEFVQVVSFGLNKEPEAEFCGSEGVRTLNVVAVPTHFVQDEDFQTLYWVMFVVAFSPYIFVITVRLLIFYYSNNKGEEAAAEMVKRFQDKIYSVLWFLVNTLYFPVISTMLAGVDCTASKDDNNPVNFLDANTEIRCFSGGHVAMMVCSMIALIIYYPAASFAQSQTQNISDIKFKPKIVFVMLQGKLVLAGVTVFFTTFPVVYLSTVLLVTLAFLGINVYFRPCLVEWVNWLRSAFFGVAAWATVSSLVGVGMYDAARNGCNSVPLILLVVGVVVCFVVFTLLYVYYRRVGQEKMNEKEMKPKSVD